MKLGQDAIEKSAMLSSDGTYRYLLTRVWDQADPLLVYIMLNPSTADGRLDDATIRVCMSRARLLGYGGILVINLFALRSTDPSPLLFHPDPVGPENDSIIRATLKRSPIAVCAWGRHGKIRSRDAAVTALCREAGVSLRAIRLNADGTPSHPLRRSISSALIPYELFEAR